MEEYCINSYMFKIAFGRSYILETELSNVFHFMNMLELKVNSCDSFKIEAFGWRINNH
jgi:hypothetical protein